MALALPLLAGLFETATAALGSLTLESTLAAVGLSTSFFTLESLGAAIGGLATRGLAFLTPSSLATFAGTTAVEALVSTEVAAGTSAILGTAGASQLAGVVGDLLGVSSVVEAGEIALGTAATGEILSVIVDTAGASSGLDATAAIGTAAAGAAAVGGTVEALAAAGITQEVVGSVTWEYILKQIAVGAGVEIVVSKLTQDPFGFFNDVVNSIIEENGDGTGQVNELLFVDPNGYIVNPLTSNFKYIDPYEIGYTSGSLACDAAISNYERNGQPFQQSDIEIVVSMLQAASENTQGRDISKKLTAYYLGPEFQNPERAQQALRLYNQVYAVYDGNYQSQPFFDKNGNVAMYDEVGQLQVYDGERGVWKIGSYELRNPTINGNFTGPLSPNDDLPTDLLDTAAFFHDVDYDRHGFFDFFGDMKLVSRLEHQFKRNENFDDNSPNPLIYATAEFTKTWFKYVSPWLSKLVSQDLGKTAAYEFLQSDEGDFYTYIMSQYKASGSDKQQFGFNSVAFRAQRLTRNEGRIHFYAGLTKAFNDKYGFYRQKYTSPQILKSINLYDL